MSRPKRHKRYVISTTDADVEAGYPETRIEVYSRNALNAAIEASTLVNVPTHRLTLFEGDPYKDELKELGNLQEYLK